MAVGSDIGADAKTVANGAKLLNENSKGVSKESPVSTFLTLKADDRKTRVKAKFQFYALENETSVTTQDLANVVSPSISLPLFLLILILP